MESMLVLKSDQKNPYVIYKEEKYELNFMKKKNELEISKENDGGSVILKSIHPKFKLTITMPGKDGKDLPKFDVAYQSDMNWKTLFDEICDKDGTAGMNFEKCKKKYMFSFTEKKCYFDPYGLKPQYVIEPFMIKDLKPQDEVLHIKLVPKRSWKCCHGKDNICTTNVLACYHNMSHKCTGGCKNKKISMIDKKEKEEVSKRHKSNPKIDGPWDVTMIEAFDCSHKPQPTKMNSFQLKLLLSFGWKEKFWTKTVDKDTRQYRWIVFECDNGDVWKFEITEKVHRRISFPCEIFKKVIGPNGKLLKKANYDLTSSESTTKNQLKNLKTINKESLQQIRRWKIITLNGKIVPKEQNVYKELFEIQRPFLDIVLEVCLKAGTSKCLKCYPSARRFCRIKCLKSDRDLEKVRKRLHLDLTRYFNYSVGSARKYLLKKRDEEFDKVYSGHTIYVWSKSVKQWHSLQYKEKTDTSKEGTDDDKIKNKHLPRIFVWKEKPKDGEVNYPNHSVGDYIKKIKAGDIEPNANGYILVFSKTAKMWHKLTVVYNKDPEYKTKVGNCRKSDQNNNAQNTDSSKN